MSFELSLKVSTIYGAKNVPVNVLVNVPIKEYEGRLTVKRWLVVGKMSVKWC